MLGKNCARALPTLAVAEASCASCRRISGRCVSNSDGRPGVTRGEPIWLSDPPLTRTDSGGRDTRVASALMFWSSVCLQVEYEAIVDAGFLLQLDCPDLALERH